jgi:hypothetical protein
MSDKMIKNDMETLKHIQKVRENIFKMILDLEQRMLNHDRSKLESPEREIFGEHHEELGKTVYGTPEYTALLEKVRPAIDHHYSKNSHHPEYYKDGINDMNLLDVLEMLLDWLASTERVKNGNIRKSIEHNTTRYGMSPQLAQIMLNTINRYF